MYKAFSGIGARVRTPRMEGALGAEDEDGDAVHSVRVAHATVPSRGALLGERTTMENESRCAPGPKILVHSSKA